MIQHLYSWLAIPDNFVAGTTLLNIMASLLIVTAMHMLVTTKIISVILSNTIFSLLLVVSYLLMDAPDVAMTEAALGSALSTVILLKILQLTNLIDGKAETTSLKSSIFYVLVVVACLVMIITYGQDFAHYGESELATHQEASAYYLANTQDEIGVKSFVAAILASYRGYDTLGETTVIVIAVIACLLGFKRNK